MVRKTYYKNFLICAHLRNIIFLFLLLIINLQSLAGTRGQIEGKIVDVKTGKSLSYVNIIVVGTSLAVDCESDGSYHLNNVPPGIYEIQARGIGYLPLTVTGVLVQADHSTELDLELFAPRTIEGREVTIEAEKKIINMDVSSRRDYSNIDEIRQVPNIYSLEGYLSFYPLRQRLGVMGRQAPDILYLTDGFFVSDNRLNTTILMPPLSAIENVIIVDGGFDAEYGNAVSCVVNVLEKEGGRDGYHGSLDFKYTLPHLPHHGSSIFDSKNVHIRPFVDVSDSLCWNGTSVLPGEEADDYESFEGWIQYAQDRQVEGDTLTPDEWRDLFMYVYRTEGSDSIGQIPGTYGDRPGYVVDFGFGGPFPGVNIITFFVSNVRAIEPFSIPVTRENYVTNKTDWKITFHLKPEMKLNVKGLFEITETVTSDSREIYPDGRIWAGSGNILSEVGGKDFIYWVDALNPYNIRRFAGGFDFSHSINASTFYNLRLFYSRFTHFSRPIWEETEYSAEFRDTTDVVSFGNISIPREIPFGYESFAGEEYYYYDLLPAGFIFSNSGRAQKDASWINTTNFSAELTSQVTPRHQLKGGLQVNYDRMGTYLYSRIPQATENIAEEVIWSGKPIRVGLYAQDRFSFEGMYTKFGLRLDYYKSDRYPAKWKISPRLGIAYPLSKSGKIYFNYGSFCQLPESYELLGMCNMYTDSIKLLGNPDLDLPEKFSFELGFEKSFLEQYAFHVSGYYNGYDNQIAEEALNDTAGGFTYMTYSNNYYGNIQGFVFSLSKKYGKFLRGYLSYDINWGTYGGVEAAEIRIKPKGSFRFLLTSQTPDSWGRIFKNISGSVLYIWRGGDYFSYDPQAANPFAPTDPHYTKNLKWQDENYWDLLLSKAISLRGFKFNFYAEVHNLFDSKYITNSLCFRGGMGSTDMLNYLESLHLPMYEYRNDRLNSLVAGNDEVGDLDADYIDKPDFEYLYYTNPRFFRMGIRVDF